MNILGIETSCDETAAAIITLDKDSGLLRPLSNVVSSQIKLHAAWGGVVPNLAAREHLKNILPVIETSLKEASLTKKDIDLIAITNGPGLIPALLVGTTAAKTIAYAWKKPLIGIHHIEGHIYANFISDEISANLKSKIQNPKKITNSKLENEEIIFPILCLVVSGGHTQLILMKDHLQYEIVGETQDDAAGEAFDKVARILGLGYPGGPAIAAAASKFEALADRKKLTTINFPRPMINSQNLNFSFSGLKTAVLYFVKKNQEKMQDEKFIQQISYEFQQAVIEVLVSKTMAAAEIYKPKKIFLAGGVSANAKLQNSLKEAIEKNIPGVHHYEPIKNTYSVDNAAMIAAAAFFRYQKNNQNDTWLSNWKNLKTEANLKLSK